MRLGFIHKNYGFSQLSTTKSPTAAAGGGLKKFSASITVNKTPVSNRRNRILAEAESKLTSMASAQGYGMMFSEITTVPTNCRGQAGSTCTLVASATFKKTSSQGQTQTTSSSSSSSSSDDEIEWQPWMTDVVVSTIPTLAPMVADSNSGATESSQEAQAHQEQVDFMNQRNALVEDINSHLQAYLADPSYRDLVVSKVEAAYANGYLTDEEYQSYSTSISNVDANHQYAASANQSMPQTTGTTTIDVDIPSSTESGESTTQPPEITIQVLNAIADAYVVGGTDADGNLIDDSYINTLFVGGVIDETSLAVIYDRIALLSASQQTNNVVNQTNQQTDQDGDDDSNGDDEGVPWYKNTTNQVIMGAVLLSALSFGAYKVSK